ncbi:MAG TPA: hypothetical protein PLT82_10770 [Candidatus Hydrogenedens sp.]|nr:hypothetical protein [Candidatus Hydrogenedens sp.]HOK10030.1 hypothetical protein [Candidatus Hydrogenedens sp.]HOL19978.1 hypothetical protein [Candidatus Hydrogenedens sp.]HPP59604.1 hypothetical protein [Candidatus Hydrogenedens sp.]
MNLIETIEQICLSILDENPDPWVPIKELVQKCKEITGNQSINESLLSSFLSKHPEVKVINPLMSDEPVIAQMIKENKLDLSPVAILKKRLPNDKDMFIWIYNHLTQLIELLNKMEAEEITEVKKDKINNILQKANSLQEKIKEHIK